MSDTDLILLGNLRFYGFHGVIPEEAKLGQEFIIDLTIETNLSRAGHSDDLHDTISYTDVYTLVRRIVEGERYNLLEALAENLAASILKHHPLVSSVTVRVTKPNAPIPGLGSGRVGVEIRRSRDK
jgi:7,8-dihydroneopterin aldolase/epimerase/oxygenase